MSEKRDDDEKTAVSDPAACSPLSGRINAANSLLRWVEDIGDDVLRISGIVHDNPELFGATIGQSTIKVAADMLEKVVLASKILEASKANRVAT